jgi:hypothetical protein
MRVDSTLVCRGLLGTSFMVELRVGSHDKIGKVSDGQIDGYSRWERLFRASSEGEA